MTLIQSDLSSAEEDPTEISTAQPSESFESAWLDNIDMHWGGRLKTIGSVAFARDDTVHAVGLRLRRPFAPHLDVFLRYDYIRLDSNIGVFEYDQHAISAGLAMRF